MDHEPANWTLPGIVVPRHYELHIHAIDLGAPWTFQGRVRIECQTLRESTCIVLNARDLNVTLAVVNDHPIQGTSYDADNQRLTLELAETLRPSETVVICIEYTGQITDSMAGFYRSRYRPAVPAVESVPRDADHHYHLSTQFEACDARRAFPCFDEPALKATFSLMVEAPADQVVLSNMPVSSRTPCQGKPGWQVVRFEKTPVMSTYLLAWAVGDFEYLERMTERKYGGKPLPFRIYTTKGLKHRAAYALEYGPRIIDHYSDLFGVEYPLPHVQCLTVSEFFIDIYLEENWGLVLYREASLLSDMETSDAKKKFIVYVLGHELAHQWFGNLVTMQWWSSLWLNEGFATWVGWLAVDHVHPEWNVWEQFTAEAGDTVLQLDSLRSSHPIEVPLHNALEVDQVFDEISYHKGCYVIRMLANYLGETIFLKGVSLYLKRHAYGNATTEDLWSAVSEASGQQIAEMIGPWINAIGYPVLNVMEEDAQISVRQSRFLSSGDCKPEDDSTRWWLPLQVRSGSEVHNISLQQRTDTLRGIEQQFYKINSLSSGCYRVNYPPSRLVKLGQKLDKLDGSDIIGLINDASALAFAGEASTPALLAFIENCKHQASLYVWTSIINALVKIATAFGSRSTVSDGLQAFARELLSSQVDSMGWEATPGESFTTTELRSLILLSAGTNGSVEVSEEARRRFTKHASGTSSISSSLRPTIYALAMQHGTQKEYDQLVEEWRKTTSTDGQQNIYNALGYLRAPDLISQYLKMLFTQASTQDIHFGALSLSSNPAARHLLWQYIRDNFDAILSQHGSNLMIIDRLLLLSLRQFDDRQTADEIRAFFAERDTKGYDRTVSIILATIASRAAYHDRDVAVVETWLKERRYE